MDVKLGVHEFESRGLGFRDWLFVVIFWSYIEGTPYSGISHIAKHKNTLRRIKEKFSNTVLRECHPCLIVLGLF